MKIFRQRKFPDLQCSQTTYSICVGGWVGGCLDGKLCDEVSVLRATALGRPIDLRVEKKYYKACIYMVSGEG